MLVYAINTKWLSADSANALYYNRTLSIYIRPYLVSRIGYMGLLESFFFFYIYNKRLPWYSIRLLICKLI